MDAQSLITYRALGNINTAIANATSFEESLHTCLRILHTSLGISHITFWAANESSNELRPVLWFGTTDLTANVHNDDKSAVWKTYDTQSAQRAIEFKPSDDQATCDDYPNIEIRTMICTPLSSRTVKHGVLQFVNKDDGTSFLQEEADVVEMFSLIFAMNAPQTTLSSEAWIPGRVILSAHQIIKEYKNGSSVTKVLRGINLNVFEGEFLILLGESGCGKSTLLNIFAGLDEVTSGEVYFNGAEHTAASDRTLTSFRRKNVGIVFQNYNLMPTLSTQRNLSLIGELVDDPLPIDEALELVGLGNRKKSRPSQLSGGQQQRVSIARALVKKPSLLLADEPTAALDYETSLEVLQTFERIRETGTTIVMVTHNEEICRMANRIARIRNGQLYEVTINKSPALARDLVW